VGPSRSERHGEVKILDPTGTRTPAPVNSCMNRINNKYDPEMQCVPRRRVNFPINGSFLKPAVLVSERHGAAGWEKTKFGLC
jgi:hypothetical protein